MNSENKPMYGIYNLNKNSFQFQIRAESPAEAMRALAGKIGKAAANLKFVPKEIPNNHYGIYNKYRQCFQFRIAEETPEDAMAKLSEKIGEATYSGKFEAREIPGKVKQIAGEY